MQQFIFILYYKGTKFIVGIDEFEDLATAKQYVCDTFSDDVFDVIFVGTFDTLFNDFIVVDVPRTAFLNPIYVKPFNSKKHGNTRKSK